MFLRTDDPREFVSAGIDRRELVRESDGEGARISGAIGGVLGEGAEEEGVEIGRDLLLGCERAGRRRGRYGMGGEDLEYVYARERGSAREQFEEDHAHQEMGPAVGAHVDRRGQDHDLTVGASQKRELSRVMAESRSLMSAPRGQRSTESTTPSPQTPPPVSVPEADSPEADVVMPVDSGGITIVVDPLVDVVPESVAVIKRNGRRWGSGWRARWLGWSGAGMTPWA
jgi:hypothetical protein